MSIFLNITKQRTGQANNNKRVMVSNT